ncbi:FkbM family methyltransferase [Ralstonia insidiosa]|nr:FkbM family methyltransferase [Ralstonia insidiosa]MBX3775489.1 FkbM family methyltransferase [Ralstonia pickettii]NPA01110.1 FkbM family methyltransferase [Betaproteobacteria bacterium]MBX3814351.1 FkbM family methyltransferase [Ralstonia pickettii]MBX3820150.1 FkbM family methyltransferase [Ralstonia insidiosa]MBX3838664.1 FkbM family methyltransferase [Ralstonia insidiosa]
MFEAIDWFFDHVEEGVILEDDCFPDPSFFRFCGELLQRYRSDRRIFGISGSSCISDVEIAASYWFLETPLISGLATWRRSWQMVDVRATEWPKLRQSRQVQNLLQRTTEVPSWLGHLDDLHSEKGGIWSSAVIYAMLTHNELCISPACNLVGKGGGGVSGVYRGYEGHELSRLSVLPMTFPLVHPAWIEGSVGSKGYAAHAGDPISRANPRGGFAGATGNPSIHYPSLKDLVGDAVRQLAAESAHQDGNLPNPENEAVSGNVALGGCVAFVPLQDRDSAEYAPSMGDFIEQLIITSIPTPVSVPPTVGAAESLRSNGLTGGPAPNITGNLANLLLLDGDEFIQGAYLTILGRQPDSIGITYYRERLKGGASRLQVLGQLANSGEGKSAAGWRERLRWPYFFLKRRQVFLFGWVVEVVCAVRQYHLREILDRDGDRFISEAFRAVLGREPDSVGKEHYSTRLSAGQGKLSILVDIKRSSEGKSAGNRVAGLSLVVALKRLGELPVIKQMIDVVSLPKVVAENLKIARGLAHDVRQLSLHHESSLAGIMDVLQSGRTEVLQLVAENRNQSREANAQLMVEFAALTAEVRDGDRRLKSALDTLEENLRTTIRSAVIPLQADLAAVSAEVGEYDQHLKSGLGVLEGNVGARIQSATASLQTELVAVSAEVSEYDRHMKSVLGVLEKSVGEKVQSAAASLQAGLAAVSAEVSDDVRYFKSALNVLEEDVGVNIRSTAAQLDLSITKALNDVREEMLIHISDQAAANAQLIGRIEGHASHLASLVSAENARVVDSVSSEAGALRKAIKLSQDWLSDGLRDSEGKLTRILSDYQGELMRHNRDASADLGRVIIRESSHLAAAFPKAIQETQGTILSKLSDGLAAQELLRSKFAMLTSQLDRFKHDMAARMQDAKTHLARTVEEAHLALNEAFPQSIESANRAILTKLVDGHALQQQLHTELSRFAPQMDRIEVYSLAGARRHAVPCGAGPVMVRTAVGYVLCGADDHALIASLIESGELESGTRQLIERLLSPGDVFIDVGANVGMHSLAAARTMGGDGRVIAFEPYTPTAQLLERTTWMNGFAEMIEIHNVAVSNEQTERTLYLGMTSGHHSLYPLDPSFSASESSIQVQVTTLDHAMAQLPAANLIKIDVEGEETAVIAGAKALLARSDDVGVIVEFGLSHLKRVGLTVRAWLENFDVLGFEYRAIHAETGELYNISVADLEITSTVNLFFARPLSKMWNRAGS